MCSRKKWMAKISLDNNVMGTDMLPSIDKVVKPFNFSCINDLKVGFNQPQFLNNFYGSRDSFSKFPAHYWIFRLNIFLIPTKSRIFKFSPSKIFIHF
jgi:hypothetical protein